MDKEIGEHYLATSLKMLQGIKKRAEKSLSQVADYDMYDWLPDNDSNSLSILVRHFSGNMKSRWSDIFNTDGEKASRKRDSEFDEFLKVDQDSLMKDWEEAWNITLDTISSLTSDDLMKTIYIRSEPHTVLEAISRQLDHYSAHLGQIIFIVK
ncbi:MAG: DUF1572 family protein, partial [Candidatus Kariarchaeaceae archaeon]